MGGPWDNYAPTTAQGPWTKYAPSAAATADTRPTSWSLGFKEGLTKIFDNAAQTLHDVTDKALPVMGLGVPGEAELVDKAGEAMGLTSLGDAKQQHKQQFAEAEKKERPSGWGKFTGEVVGTLPVAVENPWLAGAGIGYLTSEPDSSGMEKAIDTGVGALTGGVGAHVIGSAARAAAPALRSAEGRASDYIARLMERSGKKAEDIEKFGQTTFGKPVTGAEALGRQGKTALTALGRREGSTPDVSEGYFAARRAERAGRMLDDVTHVTGTDPEAAQGKLDTLVAEGKKEARPLFEIAETARPQTSKYLQRLWKEPLIQLGIQHGIKIERLAALAENRPFEPHSYAIIGFKPVERGGAPDLPFSPSFGSFERQEIEPVMGETPTWKAWFAAKTGIDHILETNYRNKLTGRLELNDLGKQIDAVRRSLLKELDRLNPAYKAARAKSGDYLSAREAFNDGAKALLNGGVTEQQFATRLSNMSPTDVAALKGGITNQLWNLAQNGRIKPQLLGTQRIKAKLAMVFEPEQAAQLIERFKVEGDMLASENRIPPGFGSVTSEVLNAKDEQSVPAEVMNELAHAGVYYAGGMHHGAMFRVANAIKMLAAWGQTHDMPVEVRNAVGSMLMMTPDELATHVRARPQIIDDIRKFVGHIERGTGRAAAVGATQAITSPNTQPPPQ